MATRDDILGEASQLVYGDRQDDYGSPEDNFLRIAKLWSVVLEMEIETWQVALCMNQVKVARLVNAPAKLDGWVDGAAYMALGGELATE